jgi:hypothetical protein
MKNNLTGFPAFLSFLLLFTFTSARGDTLVTFSVDMGTYILQGAFTPNSDTIEAHGTFNNWGTLLLVQQGNTTVYTNTIDDTSDVNGGQMEYKFVIDGNSWETPASQCNRDVLLPVASGSKLVLPTAFFSDDGAPATYNVTFQVDVTEQIALGNFIPGTSYVEVRGMGLPNSWYGGNSLTNNPTLMLTNSFGMVTSNVWVGTFPVTGSPGGADELKYVIQPSGYWETPDAVNQDCNGNRYFANVAQTLPVVSFNDAPPTLVSFNVDLSAVAATDPNFNPYSVTLNGDFNNWGGGIAMTNNPSAANPNVYTTEIALLAGTTVNYQFRYNEWNTGYIVYDLSNGICGGRNNRQLVVPNLPNANVPAVLFNDATTNDYFTTPVAVTFSVNMAGAVGTDGHIFDPSMDSVYVNGETIAWYPWEGGYYYNPVPYGFQLLPAGATLVYTNTLILPPGTTVGFQYKYGMDPESQFGGPLDDEAPLGQNHYRVVRTTQISPYPMPMDTFGSQYVEPFFDLHEPAGAGLAIGRKSAGKVPVTWLGRPGAHLQVGTNLLKGAWTDLPATDGTNWALGFFSTNGFVSQTNWPAINTEFFRVVKP